MLRITRTQESATAILLKLEGRLLEPWLGELRRASERSAEQRGLRLDLSGLQFADASGVALLREMAESGAVLTGCSPLVAGLLRAAADEPPQRVDGCD
jgi:ABC-type transporter Mla MlaB component